MPRTLPETILRSINAETTDEVYLTLLTIEDDTLSTPLRFVSGSDTAVTSDGATYDPAPFVAALPEDGTDRLPEVVIAFPAVDDMPMESIGGIVEPVRFRLACVAASDPDTVLMGPFDMLLKDAADKGDRTEFRVGYEDPLNVSLVRDVYSPTIAPGLHK